MHAIQAAAVGFQMSPDVPDSPLTDFCPSLCRALAISALPKRFIAQVLLPVV